jgi:hypothetical protein
MGDATDSLFNQFIQIVFFDFLVWPNARNMGIRRYGSFHSYQINILQIIKGSVLYNL